MKSIDHNLFKTDKEEWLRQSEAQIFSKTKAQHKADLFLNLRNNLDKWWMVDLIERELIQLEHDQ